MDYRELLKKYVRLAGETDIDCYNTEGFTPEEVEAIREIETELSNE